MFLCRYSLFFLITTLATGCAYVAQDWHDAEAWHGIPADAAPWIAPAKRVTPQIKVVSYFSIPPLPFPEQISYRWADDKGQVLNGGPIDASQLASISEWLRATPMWNQWPPYFQDTRRACPVKFALVSLRPTIVLMWQPEDERKPRPPTSAREPRPSDPLIPGLTAILECTTAIPPTLRLSWFSPDLRTGPEPVERVDDHHARIRLAKGEVFLTLSDQGWDAVRR